ncbi:metal ABC transporter ATP-binding protein [Alkalimarinus alittae]|uniref:ATP-binding cassette domain-containing protein n=1 Tax=Alkalimarinus alittae TaxID=2961619 RepID=A0ABY6N4Z4_9ALTE|nr:ATP-binding cassette domain-containing protein [Alkalimarinus alittae]UZE97080.1 ATP-binding cassette domain-containing protein [Alkalimarinus alittae]
MMNNHALDGPCIRLDQAGVRVDSTQLVAPVSTQLESGQWHAILGPNGGGKSTLLKMLMGLMPHHGLVNIDWPQGEKGQIGYMPQMLPFDRSVPISVLDYVLMSVSTKPLWFARRLTPEVKVVMEKLRLSHMLNRKIGALSGGERQRLLLASALLQSPSLLVLDEPLSGLDQAGQKEILGLFSAFNKRGGTIVMVEHDWQVVIDYCHQAYWVEGELKAKGAPAEVLECFSPVLRKWSDNNRTVA